MNKYIILSLLLLFCFCRSSKDIEKRKLKKEYETRQKDIEEREAFRKKYPCDTATNTILRTDTIVQYGTPDTIIGPGDTIYIHRPSTITRYVDKIITVIDEAQVKNARDSIAQFDYQLSQITELANKQAADLESKETQLKTYSKTQHVWMWRAIGTWIALALFTGGLVFLKIKSII